MVGMLLSARVGASDSPLVSSFGPLHRRGGERPQRIQTIKDVVMSSRLGAGRGRRALAAWDWVGGSRGVAHTGTTFYGSR
jgi:hypothetical protein